MATVAATMTAATFKPAATSEPPTAAPPARAGRRPRRHLRLAAAVPAPFARDRRRAPIVGSDAAAAAFGAPLKSASPMGRGSTRDP